MQVTHAFTMDVAQTAKPAKSAKTAKPAKPAKPAKSAVTAKNAEKGTKRKRDEVVAPVKRQNREDVSDREVDDYLESVMDHGEAKENSEVMIVEGEEAEAAAQLVRDSERFDFLFNQWEKMQVDGNEHLQVATTFVTLEWLEQHVAPLLEAPYTPPASPVPPPMQEPVEPVTVPCPFHESTLMEIRYPVSADKSMYMFCPLPACPVFTTVDKSQAVMQELITNTNEEVRCRLTSFEALQCKCGLIPKMRLSQTERNRNRVFLTCGQPGIDNQCKYFQWMHGPLWKPKRPFQPTFGNGCPRESAKPIGTDKKEWHWKPIGSEKNANWNSEMSAEKRKELTEKLKQMQQLTQYVSESAHPADKFLSDLGRDIRAAQEERKEAAFVKRHNEENKLLQAQGMMPRSLEFHKTYGFGMF